MAPESQRLASTCSLSPNGSIVGGEGWGEGAAHNVDATQTLPPHPTLSPHPARGRGLFAAWMFVLLSLLSFPAFAQQAFEFDPADAGKDLDVSLITFGPGEEVWERFGHNAILITLHAPDSHARVLYNYGMFDFQQDNFWT